MNAKSFVLLDCQVVHVIFAGVACIICGSVIYFLYNSVDVCDGWVSVLGSLRNLVLIKRIVDIYVFSGKFNCRSTLSLSGLCIIIAACLVPTVDAVHPGDETDPDIWK